MNFTAFKIRLSRWLLAYAPELYGRLAGKGGQDDGTRGLRRTPGRMPGDMDRQPRVLVVDHDFPELGRDAGSKAIFHLASLLNDKGKVTFWSASSRPSLAGRALLQSMGIQVVTRQAGRDLLQWLASLTEGESFDAAVLSRPIIAAMYAPAVQAYVGGVCAYYGHDIHHVRLAGMKAFTASAGLVAEQREVGLIERRLWRTMDAVFYPSSEEVDVVNTFRKFHGLEPNAAVMPLWDAPEAPAVIAPASARSGMLFVGSYEHAPNTDGLNWFFRAVLPEVRKLGVQDVVYVVGCGMSSYRPPTDDACVVVLGHIDDEALDEIYAKTRVALIPLRYGAGVKGKVIEAMGKGVPCVTTHVGAHGISWARDILEPVDSAGDFARLVARLEQDEVLWQQKSSEGLRLLSAAYERSAISSRLFNALGLDRTPVSYQ